MRQDNALTRVPPHEVWAEAVVHAAKIRNHFVGPNDEKKNSLELMVGKKPDVTFFRIFGGLGWYHILKELRKKLDPKLS